MSFFLTNCLPLNSWTDGQNPPLFFRGGTLNNNDSKFTSFVINFFKKLINFCKVK